VEGATKGRTAREASAVSGRIGSSCVLQAAPRPSAHSLIDTTSFTALVAAECKVPLETKADRFDFSLAVAMALRRHQRGARHGDGEGSDELRAALASAPDG
jgi:hypothetical protein